MFINLTMDSDKMELDYELMEKYNKIDNKNQLSFNTKIIKNPFMTYNKNPFIDDKNEKKDDNNKMDLDD